MLGLPFANPAYLVAGAALISAPIIIHLINRMRFKRVRWAAMEFLLKAQKKSRRRLIIEQLILLMLRCLLVALTALLVLRYLDVGLDQLFGTRGRECFPDPWAARDAYIDVLLDRSPETVQSFFKRHGYPDLDEVLLRECGELSQRMGIEVFREVMQSMAPEFEKRGVKAPLK